MHDLTPNPCGAALARPQVAAPTRQSRLAVLRAVPPEGRHTDPHTMLNVDAAPMETDPGDLGR